MAIGRVIVDLETQHASFSQGTQAAGQSLDTLGESAKRCKKDVDGVKGALDELKESAGRGSSLDELGKTLKGAGAVMGISLIGEELKSVTEKAEKLNEQFRAGQTDASGLAVSIGESLPVIGSFVSAGQSIREMFTHEKEQIDDINADTAAGNKLWEDRVKIHEEVKKTLDEIGEKSRKAAQELTILQASPQDRPALERKFAAENNAEESSKQYAEEEKKRREALDKEIADIKHQSDTRKKLMEEDAAQKYWDGSDDTDDYDNVEEAQAAADAKNVAIENIQINGAKQRAAKDLEEIKKGLDNETKLKDEALKQQATNAAAHSFFKDAEEDAKHFLDQVAHVGEEVNKAAEKAKHDGAEKSRRDMEQAQREAEEAQKRIDRRLAEGDKKERDAAASVIEGTLSPMQKAQAEIAKIQKLYNENLLTKAQADAAIDKATKDLDEKDHGDKKAKLETRRFDFRMPPEHPEKADKAAELSATAKAQLDSQKNVEFYQLQQYLWGLDDQNNQDTVVDL